MEKPSFFRRNGLSLVLLFLTLLTLYGNVRTGWHELNDELLDHGRPALPFGRYLTSGHCIEAVFENWESEFLQMALYVWLTVYLVQKGSKESNSLEGDDENRREPDPTKPDAPWPVKRGGWVLKLYENSLTLAFLTLFLLSFVLHAFGGTKQYNLEQELLGKSERLTVPQFLGTSQFWFQSLQNWQSEFLSVLAIVVLTIFLRQRGSPESKPVDAADGETGG
jgi:hypothetical protein